MEVSISQVILGCTFANMALYIKPSVLILFGRMGLLSPGCLGIIISALYFVEKLTFSRGTLILNAWYACSQILLEGHLTAAYLINRMPSWV
jgi:hypothetical protein